VKNINVVDQNMMGAQNLEIYLDLKKENAFQDPFVMNVVDELQHKMEKQYSHLVKRTTSLVDIVKDSYQKLNQGREEMYSIPKDQRLLSQTLFLYNNANVDDRRRLVSDDYSKSHISIQLKNTGSYEYTDIFDRMRKDIDESLGKLKQKYPDTTVSITGMLPLMIWGEIQSFALALVIICTFLLVIFGSFKAGLIALIPNLIPCTLTFGLLGLLGIPLDFNTMMLAPIIIGIAVDDTIHCVTHYRNEVLKDGDIKRALQNMIQETGQAITFATLVLGLGFAVMAFSDYSGTRNTGIFGSLAIFSGLLSEMFLLPSIILVTKFKFQNQKAKDVETGLEVINIH
jgi:predicted RND superfamily exporter protein